ncbi:unnamed protein product [Gadus morhua 'NCC']
MKGAVYTRGTHLDPISSHLAQDPDLRLRAPDKHPRALGTEVLETLWFLWGSLAPAHQMLAQGFKPAVRGPSWGPPDTHQPMRWSPQNTSLCQAGGGGVGVLGRYRVRSPNGPERLTPDP